MPQTRSHPALPGPLVLPLPTLGCGFSGIGAVAQVLMTPYRPGRGWLLLPAAQE